METEMKHFSLSKRKINELQEIAEREGRKDYSLVREAIADFLKNKETNVKVHPEAPGESIVRSNDQVRRLRYSEMWTEEGDLDNPKDGMVVRAMEHSGEYFTYYKYVYNGENYVCHTVAPMKHELLDEMKSRADKMRS